MEEEVFYSFLVTVLVILIASTAIAFAWLVVRPALIDAVEYTTEPMCSELSLVVVSCKISANNITTVEIRKDAGENMSGLRLIFDSNGEILIDESRDVENGQGRVFTYNREDISDSVSVGVSGVIGDFICEPRSFVNCEMEVVIANNQTAPESVACNDGNDNDNDGWIDFDDDPGCAYGLDGDESNSNMSFQCSDGLDNDIDGDIDGHDNECTSWNDNNESASSTILIFNNNTYNYFISPGGSDSNTGSFSSPFATLGRARDEVRSLKNSLGTLDKPVNIFLREGTYVLRETFVLDERDSGTMQNTIIYQAYPGENAIITGSVRVSGWTQQGNIYFSDLSALGLSSYDINSLFVDGHRATRARAPNSGFYLISSVDGLTNTTAFNFNSGNINPAWLNLREAEVISYRHWVQSRMKIDSVSGNKVFFRGSLLPGYGYDWDYVPGTGRYYVENVRELLDSAGEWYLDKNSRVLYYWPYNGVNPEQLDVRVPVLQQLFVVKGKESDLARNIYVRGITFTDTDWSIGDGGYRGGGQAGSTIKDPPTIDFAYTNDCRFEDNIIRNTGAYALGSFSKNLQIIGNEIYAAGAGGIKVGRSDPDNHQGFAFGENNNFVDSNTISHNKIHDLNDIYKEGVGIWTILSANNVISHNLVYNTAYTGISVGGRWHGGEEPPNIPRNNIIEYNEVHDVMRELNDGGALYFVGRQPGSKVRNNLIYNVKKTPLHLHDRDFGGLNFDQGSSSFEIKNNIVYNTGICLSLHRNFNQLVENNIFVDCYGVALLLQAYTDQPDWYTGQVPTGNIIRRNIIYDTTNPTTFIVIPTPLPPTGTSTHTLVESDYNLFFTTTSQSTFPVNLNWWTNYTGFENHSLLWPNANANPQFVNYEQKDFRLSSSSPALQSPINFVNIDLSSVGPQI